MAILERVTAWLFVEHPPEPSDIIFIAGSPSAEPVRRAASLYLRGFAPLVLPSGSRWLFHGRGVGSEWEAMRDALLSAGVPEEAILREDRARHTVDNARLSARLCRHRGIPVNTAILCCQAYHARRCLQDYRRAFPSVRFAVCPADTRGISRGNWQYTPLGVFKVLTELLKCTKLFYVLIRRTGAGAGEDNAS